MKQFNQQVDAYIPGKAEKSYLHTMEAGAFLPFLQAFISGVFAGLAAMIVSWALRAREPWVWGGIAWALVMMLTWFLTQRHWFTLTAERLTGIDFNRDGVLGDERPSAPREVSVRISEVTKDKQYRQTVGTLPASYEQMQKLAEGILNNKLEFTVRNFCGDKKPFSVDEFNDLREAFLKRDVDGEKLLRSKSDKDARRGYEFTEAGKQVLQGFLVENSV